MSKTALRYDFASDNTAGLAPEALSALVAANTGFSAAYGTDTTTAAAADALRAWLDADVPVYFLTTGTAANAVCLAALCRPFETVLAHRYAHTITSEAGAPNFFGQGLAIAGLEGAEGRIDSRALKAALDVADASQRQSPAALSLANSTELGTLYTVEGMQELTQTAKSKGLATHLDGARLANAVAAGFDHRRIRHLDIDLLVIGGAKLGMPPSEAIVVFDRKLAARFDARLKQCGHIPSKGRFIAAPWLGMLLNGRWIEYAAHANAMARRLAARMPFEIRYPVQTNSIFVRMDPATHTRLRERGWVVHRIEEGSVRFMCSWASTGEAVEELARTLATLEPEIDKRQPPMQP